eukprot:498312_1
MAQEEERVYKVVVLGGGAVGKSCLTMRFIADNFMTDYDPTIEESFTKQVTIDDEACILDILDTAGQEQFASMQDQWMLEGQGFLLVYSIIDKSSFEEIEDLRDKILRVKDDDYNIPIVIAANKCDLKGQRLIDDDDGQALADDWKCTFYATSAKDKINVVECFQDLVRLIRMHKPAGKKKKKKGLGCILL